MADRYIMSQANYQWVLRDDGKDCLIVGFLNAGHVSFQSRLDGGRYKAVSHCSTAFVYGHETRYFESQDEAYDWVLEMWSQYETRRVSN